MEPGGLQRARRLPMGRQKITAEMRFEERLKHAEAEDRDAQHTAGEKPKALEDDQSSAGAEVEHWPRPWHGMDGVIYHSAAAQDGQVRRGRVKQTARRSTATAGEKRKVSEDDQSSPGAEVEILHVVGTDVVTDTSAAAQDGQVRRPRVKQTARRSTAGKAPETLMPARTAQREPTEVRKRPAPDSQDDDNLRYLHQGAPEVEEVQEVQMEKPRKFGRVKQTARRSTGYRGFGSFLSDDVERLIRQPAAASLDSIVLPAAVAAVLDRGLAELQQMRFGHAARAHFLIDFDGWTFLNHGAFGGALRAAFDVAQAWRVHCETQPLRFLDRELFPFTVHALQQLATRVGCEAVDMVFTPNATHALHAVIDSFPLTEEDTVFSLNLGYGSVKKMLATRCQAVGAYMETCDVRFPLPAGAEEDALVEQVEQALRRIDRPTLAVFDAVTSNTALVLPLRRLVKACHAVDCRVLVDGAHAMGSLPMDIAAVGADYYVTNLHKWFCSPRGAALLWINPKPTCKVRPAHRYDYYAYYEVEEPSCPPGVKPLVVSHGSGRGLLSDFVWDGCRDYSPVLTTLATLRCWDAMGWARVRDYCRSTLREAVLALTAGTYTAAWGTQSLVPLSLCAHMALVRLPPLRSTAADGAATSDHACELQNWLYEQHRIEVPVKCVQGCLYVRVSAHVYNELDDYLVLANAVCSLRESAL